MQKLFLACALLAPCSIATADVGSPEHGEREGYSGSDKEMHERQANAERIAHEMDEHEKCLESSVKAVFWCLVAEGTLYKEEKMDEPVISKKDDVGEAMKKCQDKLAKAARDCGLMDPPDLPKPGAGEKEFGDYNRDYGDWLMKIHTKVSDAARVPLVQRYVDHLKIDPLLEFLDKNSHDKESIAFILRCCSTSTLKEGLKHASEPLLERMMAAIENGDFERGYHEVDDGTRNYMRKHHHR